MDEILASIRRIIESGDEPSAKKAPVADRVADAPLRGSSIDSMPLPIPRFDIHYLSSKHDDQHDVQTEDLHEIEATDFAADHTVGRESGHEADDETEAHADMPAETWAGSLAEGAEAWSEREAGTDWTEAHDRLDATVPPAAGNENAARVEGEDDSSSADRAAPARNFSFEFDDEAFEAALRSDETWHGTVAPPSVAETAQRPVAAEAQPSPKAEMPESVLDGASALLSAQAGDQVAAAFDDLTRAIRDGQMRSMEEMAREMLRPMLQEWLEDNLPRIVERLVRDEIERIARGPRR